MNAADTSKRIANIQRLAHTLDRQFAIPGTKFRIGLDGIIGFIPGIGDTLSLGLASWILYQAHKLGIPFWLKAKMAWNLFIDWLIGTIPLVGDLFDIGWQANQKNAAIISKYFQNRIH